MFRTALIAKGLIGMTFLSLFGAGKQVRRNRSNKNRTSRTLLLESLESRQLMSAVQMSDQEQLLIELVNRTRANPAAEAALYGIDLNAGLAPGTLGPEARQPLSPNQALVNAAGLHSQDMLDHDYFSHTGLDGRSPQQRATDAGYPGGAGENIGWGGSTGSIDQNQHVYFRHERLFRSPGHRQNMLSGSYDQIGTGIRYGVFTSDGVNYNSSMATEMLGISNQQIFITGVAFNDSVIDDDFYNIGESAADIRVVATSLTGFSYETVTGRSGGYGLAVPSGTYNISFSGGGYSGLVVVPNIVVTNLNVKVDLDTAEADWQQPPTLPVVTIAASALSLLEDSPQEFVLTFSRTGSTDNALLARFNVGGTATFNIDYSTSGAASINSTQGTIEFPAGQSNVTLTLRPVAEFAIEADETITVSLLSDAAYSFGATVVRNLTIANDDSDTYVVSGTVGNDNVTVNLSNNYTITINGVERTLDRAWIRNIKFDGLGGTDQLTVTGDTELTYASLRVGSAEVHGNDYLLSADSWESITVVALVGSSATASLFDSPGNDRLFAYPSTAYISNGTYTNRVTAFSRVDVTAQGNSEGNGDEALFYDSPENDTFVSRPGEAYMSGSAFLNYTTGFNRAVAFAENGDAGGNGDQAYLYDSSGNDVLNALPNYTYISGPGHFGYAQGFNRVIGFARAGDAGGEGDRAFLYDSPGTDTLNARPESAYISGTGYFNYAEGFDTVLAYSNNPTAGDRAFLYDSPGNDYFYGNHQAGTLRGSGYTLHAAGFDEVVVDAGQGGSDLARLDDSPANDIFVGTPTASSLRGPGYQIVATAFDSVTSYANSGDAGGLGDVGYLYDSAGNDTLNALPSYAYITGTGFYNFAQGFDRIIAFANAGGSNDNAFLYDSNGDDTFSSRPTYSTLSGADTNGREFYTYVSGFEQVQARASSGYDQAYYYDSSGNDSFVATPDLAYLSGAGFFNYGSGFDRYIGIAQAGDAGGNGDTASLFGSAGDDALNALPGYTYLTGTGFYSYAGGFDRVTTRGMGGTDTAHLYGSTGADQFIHQGNLRVISGAGFYVSISDFRNVFVSFEQGGNDSATLNDTAVDDTFVGNGARAEFYGSNFYTRIISPDNVTIHGTAGGINRYRAPSDNSDPERVTFQLTVLGTWQPL